MSEKEMAARIAAHPFTAANPSFRISEVAYEVGFQSLTQFNRTFKRAFGQSPTEFRTAC
jgi:AraC-like DNA-binding protein